MKAWGFIGIVFAVVLHAGFILFGGLLLPEEKTNHGTTHTVDLVGDAAAPEKQKRLILGSQAERTAPLSLLMVRSSKK